ncbi:MAG: hypothetical protein NC390_05120 [Fusobacterium sp.]|nr:hypothetical protein [Fusobacterium sp.]
MGLAASQARLLSITSRISDNELRAQIINNQKMRLSADSSKVSENYINALNKTNLVFANYGEDDKAQNVPLTFNNLTAFNQYNNQYGLTNTAGNILISESDADKYIASGRDKEKFLKQYGIEYTTSYWDTLQAQLESNESFYSNPDGDGVAEADGTTPAQFTTGGKATNNTTTDGHYDFFDALALREMYEGKKDENGVTITPSYDEVIKTSQYTDFAGYVDSFAKQAAALKQAAAQKNQLLGSYAQAALSAGETFNKIDGLSTFPPSTTDLAAINDALKNDIGKYYDGATFDASKHVIDPDILNDFEKRDGAYHIKMPFEGYFDDQKTTKLYANGYDENALYLKFTNNTTTPASEDYYARVEDPSGNGAIVFAKINTTGTSDLYKWNGTSMVQYTYNDEAEDGSPLPITPTTNVIVNGNKVQFQFEEFDEEGNSAGTSTFQYPEFNKNNFSPIPTNNDTTNATISSVMTEAEFKAHIKDILKEQAAAIFKSIGEGTSGARLKESAFVNSYTFTDDAGETKTKTFTEDEKKILLSQTATNANVDKILQDICTLLFGEDNKNKITNSDDMTEFLDTIMSGKLKGFMDKGEVIHLKNQNLDITKNDLASKDIVYCVNAYILDTMMDLFGEPIYGYMKGGEGNWQVADEEANWYINLFNKIEKCGYQMLPKGLANSTEWIQFALENGIVIMEQIDSTANWQPITYTSCSDIIEQNDSNAATIAEAEYNKAMRQIEAKDEMFDLELKNIDTEHSSLESEYESVKKAMSGNIERTFQMYS